MHWRRRARARRLPEEVPRFLRGSGEFEGIRWLPVRFVRSPSGRCIFSRENARVAPRGLAGVLRKSRFLRDSEEPDEFNGFLQVFLASPPGLIILSIGNARAALRARCAGFLGNSSVSEGNPSTPTDLLLWGCLRSLSGFCFPGNARVAPAARAF